MYVKSDREIMQRRVRLQDAASLSCLVGGTARLQTPFYPYAMYMHGFEAHPFGGLARKYLLVDFF